MSEVVLNRTGVDQVNFNMTTSGNSVASCMLQELLLDPTQEYLVRVSELNCPTMGLPIFGYNTDGSTTVNKELFRIKIRLPGQTRQQFLRANTPAQPNPAETNPAAGAGSPGFASNFNTEGAGNQAHFTMASFITDLGKSAHIFSKKQDPALKNWPSAKRRKMLPW